jgi:hypothetical protein
MVVRDARTLKKDKFEFKLVGPDRSAWVSGDIEVAADNMADYLLKGLMQFDEIELNKKRR